MALVIEIKQENTSDIKMCKEKVKLSLFAFDMMAYVDYVKKFKKLEFVIKFSKVLNYKLMYKINVFYIVAAIGKYD